MSSITAWATIICLCAVSASVLNMMTPSGNMNKIFKYILGVFLICAVIIPISQFSLDDFEIDEDIFDEDIGTYDSDRLYDIKNEYMADSVVALIDRTLQKISVKPLETEIFMDNSDEQSISITKAVITISAEDAKSKQAITELIKNDLGIDAEVYIEEDINE